LESIRDCKYGCGKKIKYDSVSFSDGFTVSIPWELTAKGDLADIRMDSTDPFEEEHVPASMILLLGLKNFLDMLWLRDYKTEYFTKGMTLTTSYTNGRKGKVKKVPSYRPILTDDEIKKITETTLEPEPTDEEWRDGIKICWDYDLTKAERKALLQQLKADLQNDIEEIKKQYPEIADLQTPNAENKSFDKLMPADQQTLLTVFKAMCQERDRNPEGAYEDRRDKEHEQYLYGKLIPRQRTDDEIKKDAERIQQDPADEFEPTGKEACELIMTHDSGNIHGDATKVHHPDGVLNACKMCLDKHVADREKRLDMLHKEWDKKHPESTTTKLNEHQVQQGQIWDGNFQSYHVSHERFPPKTELEKEYFQFREEDLKKYPDLQYFLNAGDFEGALSHIQENINEHLHRHMWGGGDAVFRDLAMVYQKLARYDDALLAMELQLLIFPADWDYFQLVEILLDMDWGHEALSALNEMQKRISEWRTPFGIWSHEEHSIYQLFTAFTKAYRKVGNAAKEQEYTEKLVGFEKIITVDPKDRIKTREDLAKCLLKQGKFKDASVILGEANRLRDELTTPKPAEKKENLSAEEVKNFPIDHPEFIQAFANEITKQQEEKPKTGKGFEDPFPNMSEDDYVGTMEFEFRNLIVTKLMRFTNWEKDRVPQDVWERAVELKKTEETDPVLFDNEKRFIDYVDFTDYIKIFRFKKNWEKIFQPVFKDSDIFFGQLKVLQKLRNPIAHHRGNKLRNHLSKEGHGQLVQIYNYFMFMIQKDKDNQTLAVD